MKNLEIRIREIASNMDGKFWGTVPHSVFVEWDQTWTVAEDLGISDESTDEEIESALREWESGHEDYYEDEVKAYNLVLAFKDGVEESSNSVELPSDLELYRSAKSVIEQEKEDSEVRDEALDTLKQMYWDAYHQPESKYNYPDVSDCPVDIDFSSNGGYLYAADGDYTVEQAMKICMKDAFVCWFEEHTVQLWRKHE